MPMIGYARVSTGDQDVALQLDALNKAGCGTIFQDQASGAKADRPGLADALAHVRKGDILIVWKLDRLGRSLPHLIETVTELERRNVPMAPGTRIHLSGCVHACGKHHIADIGLQGANIRIEDSVVEAADIFVGGRLGDGGRLAEKSGERAVVDELPDAVERLLRERVWGASRELVGAAL